MGIQLGIAVQPNLINMKAFVALFALAAVASAESDPWYGYGYGYGLVHPYTAGYGCHNAYGAPVPCAGRKKREADPAVLLHHPYAYGAYGYAAPVLGAAVAVKPCTNVAGEKVDCALGHKDAPVENPTNPDEPELVHTSQLGICLNAYG